MYYLMNKDAVAASFHKENSRWMLLRQDAEQSWPGCDMEPDPALLAHMDAALSAIAREFGLSPADPFEKIKALQAAFDPSIRHFSEEYYHVLGLDQP